jgi:hypothetical protein
VSPPLVRLIPSHQRRLNRHECETKGEQTNKEPRKNRAGNPLRFTYNQHIEMSKRLHKRSKAERNPESAKKPAAMANVFRLLATRAAKQVAEITAGPTPPTSQRSTQKEPSR